MFFIKKWIYQVKWLFQTADIKRKLLKLYYFSMLQNSLDFDDGNGCVARFSRDNVKITIGDTVCIFDIYKNNSVSMSIKFYDQNKISRTFISKYFIFIDNANIINEETLFYAKEILNRIDNLLFDIMFKVHLNQPESFFEFSSSKVNFKKLRNDELVKDFVPSDLKKAYLNKTLKNELQDKATSNKRKVKI